MLAAILLIGLRSPISMKGISFKSDAYGKKTIRDFQSMIDFISRDKRDSY